jgi:hypothetical protein
MVDFEMMLCRGLLDRPVSQHSSAPQIFRIARTHIYSQVNHTGHDVNTVRFDP